VIAIPGRDAPVAPPEVEPHERRELRPNVGFSASRVPFVAASTVGQLERAAIRRYKSEAIGLLQKRKPMPKTKFDSEKVEPRFASEAIVMRKKLSAGLALAAGVLIMSVPLFAHHGNAAFDTSKRLTLKGTVTEWVWANPHCWLKFDVKNDKGEVTHWLAEETNPPGLINSGWYKDSLKVGDEVTVILIPTKNGQSLGRVDRVILANGKVLRYFGEGGGGQ
jgi:hypothetical protein